MLEAAGTEWFAPTQMELWFLVGLSIVSYQIVLHTARLDRQGETQSWTVLEEYLYRLVGWIMRRLPSRVPSLQVSSPSTPTSAQFSFEWLTKGILLPILVACFGLLSLIGAYFEPVEWFHGYTQSVSFLLMIAMAINGYFVGLMDGPDVKGPMDRFRATRPLSDWQLGVAALKNGLVSTLVALLISIVLAGLVYIYAHSCGHTHTRLWRGLYEVVGTSGPTGVIQYGVLLSTLAMLGWAGMGFNLSCISTGRHGLVAAVWATGFGLLLIGIFLSKRLSEEQIALLTNVSVIAVALAAMAATLVSFQQALARRLTPPGIVPFGAAWGGLAAGLAYAAAREQATAHGILAIGVLGVGSPGCPAAGLRSLGHRLEPTPVIVSQHIRAAPPQEAAANRGGVLAETLIACDRPDSQPFPFAGGLRQ